MRKRSIEQKRRQRAEKRAVQRKENLLEQAARRRRREHALAAEIEALGLSIPAQLIRDAAFLAGDSEDEWIEEAKEHLAALTLAYMKGAP
jgi:hypothetical protein